MWNYAPDLDEEERRRRSWMVDPAPEVTPASSTNSMVPTSSDMFAKAADPVKSAPLAPAAQQPAQPQVPTLSPAQQKYKDVLGQTPQLQDYKPSGWRRFGAALAGGLAGLRDPRMGVEIAEGINRSPYNTALESWQRSVEAGGKEAGIESQAIQQDVARRTAAAQERSAGARERTSAATEAWRRAQTSNIETPEQRRAREESTAKISHPGTFENPAYVGGYVTAKQAEEAARKGTLVDVEKLRQFGQQSQERLQQTGRMQVQGAMTGRELASIAAKGRVDKDIENLKASLATAPGAKPEQVAQAEDLAIQKVIQMNPQYAKFYNTSGRTSIFGVGIPGTGGAPHLKTAEEMGWGEVPASSQESLERDDYREFLRLKDAETKNILQTSIAAPKSSSRFEVTKK